MDLIELFFVCLGAAVVVFYGVKMVRFAKMLYPRVCFPQPDSFFTSMGEWAVVTGGSDGIGKAYAFELAGRGLNVVILSRTKDKLDRVALEIGETTGQKVKVIVADFTEDDMYEHIEENLKGLNISVLVNNVGILPSHIPCKFLQTKDLEQPLPVTKGVPQGSILGTTLFSIYINNIAQAVGSSLIHLATVFYSAGPSPDFVLNALQQSFLSVQQAFSALNLALNTSKTKVMITGVITTSEGLELEVVNSYKHLGVWLDSTLSAHIKAAGGIAPLSHQLPTNPESDDHARLRRRQRITKVINCNVKALVKMCQIVLPGMEKRGKGVIVNISSGVASVPSPMYTMYCASKVFVERFSQGLQAEYKAKRIMIQAVAPFGVSTPMTGYQKSNMVTLTAEDFVRTSLEYLQAGDKTYGSICHTVLAWMVQAVPQQILHSETMQDSLLEYVKKRVGT